jgi:hypothetical protein
MPPGLSEADWAVLHDVDEIPAYIPGEHAAPETLGRVADVGDILERTTDRPFEQDSETTANVGRIDLLAWYGSFRTGDHWGIFVREFGIEAVAQALAGEGQGIEHRHRRIAMHVLYVHEYAHFLFDVAAQSVEDLIGTGVYKSYRREVLGRSPEYHETAEALCNAFAYRHADARGVRARLRAYLRRAPIGYRDFAGYLEADAFSEGVEQVIGEMVRGLGGSPAIGSRGLFDDSAHFVSPGLVPIWLVREPQVATYFALITALGQIEATSRFRRDLKKLPAHVQTAWQREVEPGLMVDVRKNKFKRLSDGRYSARVQGDYRVILERTSSGWAAVEIGHRREVYENRG